MNPPAYQGGFKAWFRFAAGLALLCGFAFFLSRGYAPPGAAGEVLRHNLRLGIDATPLFYTEVDDSPNHTYSELFIDKPTGP
ncbi:MAG: hypothetical protein KJ645_11685 [Planctomycetes bacterium]|nr:hypothetical protein [Planctomycetota bacterium]